MKPAITLVAALLLVPVVALHAAEPKEAAKPRSAQKAISYQSADKFVSAAQKNLGWSERVRSVSMNYYMGGGPTKPAVNSGGVVYRKMNQMRKNPPCKAWVFVDEHPDTINDGAMHPGGFLSLHWMDMPGSLHNKACGFAFADGHSEIHRWLVGATSVPVRFVDWYAVGFDASFDARDIRWVRERTTELP